MRDDRATKLPEGQASVGGDTEGLPVYEHGDFTDIQDWQAVIRETPRVDDVRPLSRMDQLVRFWRVYLAAGFCLPVAAGVTMAVYAINTPNGSHRSLLLAVSAGYVTAGGIGLALSNRLAQRPWRARFAASWVSIACLAIAVCAGLDGGVDSPLLIPIVLPVMYAALALRPRAVALCSGAAVGGVAVVALTDAHIQRTFQSHITMFSLLLAGVVVLAMISATIRARLESAEADLVGVLRHRAELDGLTGCANQRAFYQLVHKEVDQAIRYERPLAMMICDADLFKAFNDNHGHPAGDAALISLAETLKSTARATDLVARVGGDEFAVLMPNTTASQAAVLADRIVHTMAAASAISVSIGVSELDPANPIPARMIRDADAALYDAKESGRRTVITAGARPAHGAQAEPIPMRSGADLELADRKRMAGAVRQARRESQESRTILGTLMHDAPVGFAFIDREFRVALVNPTLAAITGVPMREQVGRTVAELVPAFWPALEPLFRRALDDQEPVLDIELRGPTAGDSKDHDWLGSIYPIRVDDEMIGLGAMALDITDRKRLERAQSELTDAVVGAMSATAEARDPYTAGHQHRVADIAAAIATELGYDDNTVHGVALAAVIHDIGKVAVPAEILARPGRLSEAEMQLVRTHPTIGYEIVRDIEFPWPIAQMILQHHERIDGSGYPNQLRGDEINIGARIIAVADTLEAMSAHRPYRASLGLDQALSAIEAASGRGFDPAVVDACLRLFDNGPLAANLCRLIQGEQAHL